MMPKFLATTKKKKRNHFNWIRFDAVVFEIATIGTKSYVSVIFQTVASVPLIHPQVDSFHDEFGRSDQICVLI